VSTTPAQQTGQGTAAPAAFDVDSFLSKLPQNNNIFSEQQRAFASSLAESVKGKEELIAGARSAAAGENSPAAKAFQTHMQQFEKQWIDDHMQKATQANPELAATPQGWAGMFAQATDAWQQMPQEMKWITGLGLGGGLLGMASSIFGEGGMGMGLLGLLGIGVGGFAGAMGGMFGQGAQQATSDMAYNVGSFFGAVPEAGSMTGKFNDLKAPNAVDVLAAAPTLEEKTQTYWNAAAKQEEVRKQLALIDQVKNFMKVPEVMREDWLRKMDKTLTPEEAKMVAQNIVGLNAQLNDPASALSKKVQTGQAFAAAEDPDQYVRGQAATAVADTAANAWNTASTALGNAWNGAVNYFTGNNETPPPAPTIKQNAARSTSMNILPLIEKWAFNDVDAKELSDLKAQRAQGVPYRVEDARRANALQKRQQAEAPSKKEVVISVCQKAARCWAGYEPVPGAKAYSRGSCRPKGSKKTQKEMKKS